MSAPFFVAGAPATKGSMNAFIHPQTGKIAVRGDNPRTRAWERAVHLTALAAGVELTGREGGVIVACRFILPRPKCHHRTGRNAHLLKASAPPAPVAERSGDVDKLLRAVLDGLASVAYETDAQVLGVTGTKEYASAPDQVGCWVEVRRG